MTVTMRAKPGVFALALACLMAFGAGRAALAQDQFSPVITVNDSAITGFEISQRVRLLEVFRTPGDLPELARTQLVEDRLKEQELARAGLELTEESLTQALTDFAARANLTLEQFQTVLGQNGVEPETLRDYVRTAVTWRDYIRQRYGSRVQIGDADIDAAIDRMGNPGSGVEVLLSEIIIPAPPPQADQARAVAARIAQTTSYAVFESAAREVSALPSRDNGGRLDWVPLSNFPPALHGLILSLAPGQVTQPIEITNGVALFQMRGVREGALVPTDYARIDYAVFYAADRAEAQAVADRVDTCDDLYGVARGLPAERLVREDVPPAEVPQDIALELARLDRDEISTALTAADGTSVPVIMLCGRTPVAAAEADRDAIATQIRNERLTGYADALVADLRAAATITGE